MATANLSSELLSRKQAAEMLGVRPQTLAAWVTRGMYGLRFHRVGRLVKYKRSDLEQWLERRAVGAVDGDSE
jgi:excisionase family DNA binding protein